MGRDNAPKSHGRVKPGASTSDWLEESEEVFEQHIAEAPLKDLIDLQYRLLARFDEFEMERTVKGTPLPRSLPDYVDLGYRINTVMRQILKKRNSQEEAPIKQEFDREIEQLSQAVRGVRS